MFFGITSIAVAHILFLVWSFSILFYLSHNKVEGNESKLYLKLKMTVKIT